MQATIPVTVLTGFLGSGKTTLINRILGEAHGRRFAVIENEYGDINIDADLLVQDQAETVVQLTNGCVCCTVRGDLANALQDLLARRSAGELRFDHVLIETTGLADPGPIVRTFMAETELLARFHLDGVVTLFDALAGERSLESAVEAAAQLGYADRILMTKSDLLSEEAVANKLSVLKAAWPAAEVSAIRLPDAPWGEVFERLLDIRGYQFDRVVFTREPRAAQHTGSVNSVSFAADDWLDGERFNAALAAVHARYGEDLWRIKGVLAIEGMRNRIVVQGVQGLIQANASTVWRPFEPRRSQLVLIGRALDANWVLQQFAGALPQAAEMASP